MAQVIYGILGCLNEEQASEERLIKLEEERRSAARPKKEPELMELGTTVVRQSR